MGEIEKLREKRVAQHRAEEQKEKEEFTGSAKFLTYAAASLCFAVEFVAIELCFAHLVGAAGGGGDDVML